MKESIFEIFVSHDDINRNHFEHSFSSEYLFVQTSLIWQPDEYEEENSKDNKD